MRFELPGESCALWGVYQAQRRVKKLFAFAQPVDFIQLSHRVERFVPARLELARSLASRGRLDRASTHKCDDYLESLDFIEVLHQCEIKSCASIAVVKSCDIGEVSRHEAGVATLVILAGGLGIGRRRSHKLQDISGWRPMWMQCGGCTSRPCTNQSGPYHWFAACRASSNTTQRRWPTLESAGLVDVHHHQANLPRREDRFRLDAACRVSQPIDRIFSYRPFDHRQGC